MALEFGKHRGKTLEWLFFNDPGYVKWMIDKNVASSLKRRKRDRFEYLVRRAMNLAVPGKCLYCNSPISLMRLTKDISGRLAQVDFLCDKCPNTSSSRSLLTTPSFFIPDSFKSYKKGGEKVLVDSIKYAYYGEDVQMSQAEMEEFFDEPSNFSLPQI
jgi:hypothetical protein